MCRIPNCTLKFSDELQRSLHEATTWHCISCGFSDGSDLMRINSMEELHCILCTLCAKWQAIVDPRGSVIVVDFKHKRYRRLIKRETHVK